MKQANAALALSKLVAQSKQRLGLLCNTAAPPHICICDVTSIAKMKAASKRHLSYLAKRSAALIKAVQAAAKADPTAVKAAYDKAETEVRVLCGRLCDVLNFSTPQWKKLQERHAAQDKLIASNLKAQLDAAQRAVQAFNSKATARVREQASGTAERLILLCSWLPPRHAPLSLLRLQRPRPSRMESTGPNR